MSQTADTAAPLAASAPARPALLSSTSKKPSFLGKLSRPRVNIPRSRLPFRQAARTRADLLKPLDPSQPALGLLVVQVLAARDLVARDKNGTSDPFVCVRWGTARITSPTCYKTLNPVWSSTPASPSAESDAGDGIAGEARLTVKVFDSPALGRERIECVLWDKDRFGKKDFLGEVSLGFPDCWGSEGVWDGGVPPVGFADPDNRPVWHPVRSSRSKTAVTGELLVQVGFVPVPDSDPNTTAQQQLSPEQRERILAVFEREHAGADAKRASKEERVLLASPTEGVGTAPIWSHRDSNNGELDAHGVAVVAAGADNPVSKADESSEDEDEYGSVTDGDGNGTASSVTSDTEEDSESDLSFESDADAAEEDTRAIVEPPTPPVAATSAEGADQGEGDYFDRSKRFASPQPETPSIVTTTAAEVSTPPAHAPASIPPTPSATSISSRRGLSLPGFMRRRESAKSVTSSVANSEAPSDVDGDGDGARDAIGGVEKEKRRRFGRRAKKSSTASTSASTSAAAAASGSFLVENGGDGVEASEKPDREDKSGGGERRARKAERKMRRAARKARRRGSGRREQDDNDDEQVEGQHSKPPPAAGRSKTRRLGRRRTKRGYQYADDTDLLGLVQIEIQGAKDLPRWKNAIRISYDMDPFTVISFGNKVFRTRVIRHSLNPVWDERLFFHVRATEAQWNITFNIFDWDKVSSNDHVGDVTVPLADLIGTTIQPDHQGLYPADAEGKLTGDDFHPHSLKIAISERNATSNDHEKTAPTLQIRAKYTPYAALRQQFWRVYLRQYDIDEAGKLSHLEIYSMLDSLGSTLSKETISSFFTRFGLEDDGELSYDQVVLCLEQEVMKPKDERKRVEPDSLPSDADASNSASVPPTPGIELDSMTGSEMLSRGQVEAEAETQQQPRTDMSSDMRSIEPGTEIVTNAEEGTTITAPGAASQQTQSQSGNGKSSADRRRQPPKRQQSLAMSEDSDADKVERVVNIKECPLCHKPRMNSRAELDIITHMGICSSTDPRAVNRIVVNEFVTASQAQRKWFTKVISKATKGAYQLGADSANIIVQDRLTGALLEEKMAVYVRLGMRLAYRGFGPGGGMEGARIRRMLESMSVKQGIKFDSPASVREIQPFINFHNLDMSEVLEPVSSFENFNEFFYRKLKPDARPVAAPDDSSVLVSPADCRAMFFPTVSEATRLWIKGREFSVEKMLGEKYADRAKAFENASLAIFRLAPQDYHRYHSPVDGVMGRQESAGAQYYTVNPLAIRSQIDIYGENVRTVASIDSPAFGETIHVWVGAMMVGSWVMLHKEGDHVKRGEDMGYFKFGGSTIVSLFNNVEFDADLVENSSKCIETLVRVGMRIGKKKEAA